MSSETGQSSSSAIPPSPEHGHGHGHGHGTVEAAAFERGAFAGFIGLLHLGAGFLSTVIAAAKVILYGPGAVFEAAPFLGLFNYLYQFTSVLLWFSGIGILRASPWGRRLAAAWAISVMVLIPTGYFLRLRALGLLTPDIGWGNTVVLSYAVAVLLVVWRLELSALSERAGVWLAIRLRAVLRLGRPPGGDGGTQESALVPVHRVPQAKRGAEVARP